MTTPDPDTSTARATFVPTRFDAEKAGTFVGKVITDCAATVSVALAVLGERLGLYRAMAGAGPLTAAELAGRTQTSERYVHEWLINQAAAGYVDYEPETGRYALPDERALALTHDESPFDVAGALLYALALTRAEPRVREVFRADAGLGSDAYDDDLLEGRERLSRPGYLAHLTQSWIPALDGVRAKLERGARVAVLGCGQGTPAIILAREFPHSRVFGFDVHPASIELARARAVAAGVADRLIFAVATGTDYPGSGYDLVAYCDCLHALGDPACGIRHTRDALAPDGTVMLVEPMAGARVEDNFTPVGQLYSGVSVLLCMPSALATGAEAIGGVAADEALRAVIARGGLTRFRRVAETPLQRVFEARP